MFQRNRSLPVLLLGLFALFVAACGNSNDVNVVSGQQGNAGQNPQPFVGRFLGANNLGGGQTAVLDFTAGNAGQATGTMTVAAANVQAQAVTIAPGVYDLTGTVDPTTGAFNFSGNFPGVGPFAISGQLGSGVAQGSYQVTVNGQTFSGVVQSASQGVPNPPSGATTGTTGTTSTGGTTGTTSTGGTTGTTSTGGTTGTTSTGGTTGGTTGGGGGTQRLIQGGTLAPFTFSPDGAYNGVNPPVTGTSLISGAAVTGSSTDNTVSIAINETAVSAAGASIRALVVGVVTHNGEALVVGKSYPLATSSTASGALVSLSESTGTTVTRGWAPTSATTGSVTIVRLTDTQVELSFTFSSVGPNSAVSGNTAAGNFSTSGTVVGTLAPAR